MENIPDFSLKTTPSKEDILKREFITAKELTIITNIKKEELNYYCKFNLISYEQTHIGSIRFFNRVETLERLSLILDLRQKQYPVSYIKKNFKEAFPSKNIKK